MNALASALALVCIGLAGSASFSEPRTPVDPFGQHYVPDSSERDMRLEAQGRDCTAISVLRGAVGPRRDERAADTHFTRAEAPTRQGVPPAPLPNCRVGGLFFDKTTSESPGVPGKGITNGWVTCRDRGGKPACYRFLTRRLECAIW